MAKVMRPKEHELAAIQAMDVVDDTLIIDENGRTVWCRDLARRYRAEMRRGKEGDFHGRVIL